MSHKLPDMKAIVDCNNFYCSCERLFQPVYEHKPVVVLSNNDGCIISRSDEAKELGVEMAGPFFMAKDLVKKHEMQVFSSNYHLYGDLSWRVMETLRILLGKNNVEVYSVDEAFLNLDNFSAEELPSLAENIKQTVEKWTGIKVSVGVAPTKVLAKLANRLAKKNKHKTGCIALLDTEDKIVDALRQTAVEDVWGIGRRYADKLKERWCIYDALQLRNVNEDFAKTHLGGVTGVRLVRELKGVPAKEMEDELVTKKMIATTRMFGDPVGSLSEIKEAVATYTARAAEKLRRQFGAASVISVFVVTKEENHAVSFNRGATHSNYIILPYATSFTNELIKPAMTLVDNLFKEGVLYKKAGVMLSGIVPDQSIQGNLFLPANKNNERKLMDMIDNINFSQRNDMLKFASSGTTRNWKMRQDLRSPRYTTRWNELFEVH
ncbi:MAG: Y-family DNA polymerase [Chitinophagaceae bacterium]|nr:Y-family DNA polymerase [Chitinophagaceae bacterium]